jgi:hypothetical protein
LDATCAGSREEECDFFKLLETDIWQLLQIDDGTGGLALEFDHGKLWTLVGEDRDEGVDNLVAEIVAMLAQGSACGGLQGSAGEFFAEEALIVLEADNLIPEAYIGVPWPISACLYLLAVLWRELLYSLARGFRPNQVWAMDITYIPMARGYVYLAVVLD